MVICCLSLVIGEFGFAIACGLWYLDIVAIDFVDELLVVIYFWSQLVCGCFVAIGFASDWFDCWSWALICVVFGCWFCLDVCYGFAMLFSFLCFIVWIVFVFGWIAGSLSCFVFSFNLCFVGFVGWLCCLFVGEMVDFWVVIWFKKFNCW